MVEAQVQHHGVSVKSCPRCGRGFRTKGHYRSILRSVYGNVGMRIRRLRGCSCSGSQECSYSTLFTNKNPITPELKYLTAKIAALLPLGKAADFLGELLPISAAAAPAKPCKELAVGFDDEYVRSRDQRPERNFEIVAGKVLDGEET